MKLARDAAINRRHSLTTGAILVTAASAVFVLSGYVVNVWLGRLLGPADYGRFGVVISLLTLLNVVQNSAIPQAVARAAAQAPENAGAALRSGMELQVGLGLGMAAMLALGAPLIASVFGDPLLAPLIGIAALVLPSYGLFSLLMAFRNGLRHFTRQAVTQAAYAVAKAIAAIALAYAFRLNGALAGYVIAPIVGIIAGWHWPSSGRPRVPYRGLLRFAGPLSVFAVASVGLMSVDIFFVKAMLSSPEVAGHYAAAQNVARIPYYLLTGLAAIILPAVAAAAQRPTGIAIRTAAQALRWGTIAVLPVAALIVATRGGLINLLYSSGYGPSAEILALLGPAMAALAISSIAAGILSGLGRPAVPAVIALIGLLMSAIGCAVAVPVAGALGAAAATLVGCCVMLAGLVAVLWRTAPGSIPGLSALRVAMISCLLAVIGWMLDAHGAALVGAYLGLGVIAAALMVASRELTIEEFLAVASRLRGRSVEQ